MPKLPERSISFRSSYQKFGYISLLSHVCYMHHPSHPPQLDHFNYVQ
jgi:hypothetical protein